MSSYKIRTAAKALIEDDEKLLLIKHQRNHVYYTLPGGGQYHNEELRETLKRECLEEIGAKIIVKDIAFVFEFIADRHQNSIHKEGFHQIDFAFECKIDEAFAIEMATETDESQIGYEWVNLCDLANIILYPMHLREEIIVYYKNKRSKIYLGEIE